MGPPLGGLAQAGLTTGCRVREYAVAPRFPSADCPTGRHVWYVEFDGPAPGLARFAEAIDARLREGNADYGAHRVRRFGLEMPLVEALPDGTFLAWMRERKKVSGQGKIPRVLNAMQEGEIQRVMAQAVALER